MFVLLHLQLVQLLCQSIQFLPHFTELLHNLLLRRLCSCCPALLVVFDKTSNIFFRYSKMAQNWLARKGYLTKQGDFIKSWKRRWFRIDPEKHCMYYFEDDGERKLRGTIEVCCVCGADV